MQADAEAGAPASSPPEVPRPCGAPVRAARTPSVSAIATSGDDPAHQRRKVRVRQADDELVAQVDRPGLAEHVELQADQRERAGERDHERRDAEARDHEPVEQPDERAEPQRGHDPPASAGVAAVHDQDRHHRGAQAADRSHRQIDLAEQQDEHDADRDGGHGRLLQHQVGEVAGTEEPLVLGLEEGPDRADHQQHEKRSRLALRELATELLDHPASVPPADAGSPCSALMRRTCRETRPRRRTRPR